VAFSVRGELAFRRQTNFPEIIREFLDVSGETIESICSSVAMVSEKAAVAKSAFRCAAECGDGLSQVLRLKVRITYRHAQIQLPEQLPHHGQMNPRMRQGASP
jgi:hypothetical protein